MDPIDPKIIDLCMSEFFAKCAAVVGHDYVLTAPEQMKPYLTERRGNFKEEALAVLCPSTPQEISSLLVLCQNESVAIVPQGGNTGLVGGQVPKVGLQQPQIILSTSRLNRCRAFEEVAACLVVESGMTLRNAQEEAEKRGYLFPLSLPSEKFCTIGGNVATNAGGIHVVAYGNMRNLVHGVEVVLADGQIFSSLSSLKKDNTGYPIQSLFVGSEGTLGIITAVALKLFPKLYAPVTALVAVENPRAAIEFYLFCQKHLQRYLQACELIPKIALEFVRQHHLRCGPPLISPKYWEAPWHILVELASQDLDREASYLYKRLQDLLDQASSQKAILAYELALSHEERANLWQFRRLLSHVQTYEGVSIKHDIAVPLGCLADFLDAADTFVRDQVPSARIVAFGHIGDGNIHYNISQPLDVGPEEFLREQENIHKGIYQLVANFKGSIAAEHGIGQLKTTLLKQVKDPIFFHLMRQMKATLDPNNLLNPGKIFDISP